MKFTFTNHFQELFRDFEQVIDEDNLSGETTSNYTEDQSLGVGLAVVARYVKNMKGQIRVKSELGKGTIFGIELPFEHAKVGPASPPRMSPLIDPQAKDMLKATSDTSSATMMVSTPRVELDRLQIDSTSAMMHRTLLPSPGGEQSILASPGSQAGGSASDPPSSVTASYPFPSMAELGEHPREVLSVLIAEDNPVNARLLTRRLAKLGHGVEHVNDGQECHDRFTLNPRNVDVILMDIQMPLVDGMLSTRMIRQHEGEREELRASRPRVPIIAVSASLAEEKRSEYVRSGYV